ncbi:LOW QUALITY PROTEIN: ataxin-7-like protein 1 [Osmerus mordax]|uniref:LOW QUALITY PROTEIN: ataxin-7-like protein 1 n=1 Tax=Osmerus mordax TaxID=8014 RepID=UPI00350FD36A
MHSKNQKRHGSPCPSRAPLVPMKPKVSVAPSPGDTLAFRVPRDYPHSRFSKAPLAVYPPKGARGRTCVSLPVVSLEKMPCLGRAEGGAHVRVSCSPSTSSPSSSSSLKASPSTPSSHCTQERLANGRGPPTPRPSASPSPSDGRPGPAARSPLDKPFPSPLDRRHSQLASPRSAPPLPSPSPRPAAPLPSPAKKKHPNDTKSARPHKRLSGRVFDPNKHCGVQDPESKRQCTRSLTCKTHSLTHRRAVPGRRKQFDVLLAEHKGRAKEKDAEKDGAKERDGGQVRRESQGPGLGQAAAPSLDVAPTPPTPSKPSHLHNGRTVSTLRLRLANAHIPRVPGAVGGASASSSAPLQPPSSASDGGGASWVRVSGTDGRPSSDEGEGDPAEDPDSLACPSSPHHPRPLGCCAFSSRLLGRGHYVFDRRWDKMRLALHYMVEKHVNAQMWRKVPLAAENPPQPPTATPPAPVTLLQPPGPPFSSVPPPSSSSAASSSEGFSLVSYAPAFPQAASGTGVFNLRDPPRPPEPVSPAQGRARNGTTKTSRLPREGHLEGAKRRKISSSSLPSADPALRNGSSSSSHPSASPLPSPGPPVPAGRRKGMGRAGSGPVARAVDWYPCAEPAAPYPPPARDPALPFSSGFQPPPPPPPPPPPSSPLAYGGGAEGRKRRSPSSFGERPSKVSKASGLEAIFRRSGGLLSARPDSPRQPKMHH